MRKRNRIVVNYDNIEDDLILLAVRNYFGDMTLRHPVLIDNFNIVSEVDMNLSQLVFEKNRPDFINEEGFVVVFKNGFRVKIKYEEYFRLHKKISNVNEKFVWEFLSLGKNINELGENIPDETFQFIKDMKQKLEYNFTLVELESVNIFEEMMKLIDYDAVHIDVGRKFFAQSIDKPEFKKFRGILFRMFEGRPYDDIIWKLIKPKYEKGEGGFQSFKI